MNHRRASALLSALHDGELSARRQEAVRRHVQGCPDCAAAIRTLAATERRLAGACPAPPPLDPAAARALFQRALSEATALPRPGSPWRGRVAWSLTTALALATVAGSIWFRSGERRAGEPTAPRRLARGTTGPAPSHAPERGPPAQGERAPRRQRSLARAWRLRSGPDAGDRRVPRRLTMPGYRRRGAPRRRPAAPDRAPGPASGPPARLAQSGPRSAAVVGRRSLLLLLVTSAVPVQPIVRRLAPAAATAEPPGYARVAAYRPDASGTWSWTQVTVSSERSQPEVILTAHRQDVWQSPTTNEE